MNYLKFLALFLVFNVSAQSTWQVFPEVTPNPDNERFEDVFFLDESIGWAASGFYAAVYKTIDGGNTWVEQLNENMLGGDYYFRNIEFLNADIGFLGTLNGEVFKTVDGGDTWTTITNISPNPPAICGFDTIGTSTIYGCGAFFTPAHIIKSTDSGATWQFIDMSAYANALVEIHFLNETTGFVSGRNSNGATILKTNDGGSNWVEIYNSNIVGEYVWKLQVLETNTNALFGSVESVSPNLGKLIKSIDGGNTWSSYDAPETYIQAVGFISETHGWMGGHTTGFHETLDGGITWNNLNIGNNLNRIFIVSPTLAYASGSSIYKFTDETLSTEDFIEAKSPKLNVQILNNPVKSMLEFKVEFNSNDNLLIELYDHTGRFITQLSRETIITTGIIKRYSFNVVDLSSGLYFINFHYNAGRESIKFMKI